MEFKISQSSMVIRTVFKNYETVIKNWNSMIKIRHEYSLASWKVEFWESVGNSTIPMSLNNCIRILLFPKLLVVFITIITVEFGRFFQLLCFNDGIEPHFILRWSFKNILLQRLSIRKLFLIFRERIKSLNLYFRLLIDLLCSLLAVITGCWTCITHVFETGNTNIIKLFLSLRLTLFLISSVNYDWSEE
jgi:hypothetical protein